MASGKRKYRSQSEWASIMTDFEQSGQSQAAFCAQRGITPSSFHAWRRRLTQCPADQEFLPLPVSATAAWDVELELGSGVTLRFRRA